MTRKEALQEVGDLDYLNFKPLINGIYDDFDKQIKDLEAKNMNLFKLLADAQLTNQESWEEGYNAAKCEYGSR